MITVFDLEANGLMESADRIWCWAALVDSDGDGEYIKSYSGTDVKDLLKVLDRSSIIVGHNIVDYDFPLLKALYNWSPQREWFGGKAQRHSFDTLVASRLLYPDLPSPQGWVGKPRPHSIEAWAMRFGKEQKVGVEDWSEYTPEMLRRCEVDVKITYMLYKYLMEKIQ